MTTVRYAEGDWFAVPLRDGGYGLGLVARANRKGALLGYFFGPRRDVVPTLADAASLKPDDAVLVGTFSHLGLMQGKWTLLGRLEGWDRRQWPMPVFIRYEELTGRTFKVLYDADDPNKLIRELLVAPGETTHGPEDGAMGAGLVELRLTRLLH